MRKRNNACALLLGTSLMLSGCGKLYYASMEKIGKEKRDILAQRIIDGKKDQEKAKEQIKTTMEAFQELTGFEGGDLERVYKKLNGELQDSEDRAKAVSDRIKSIDQVSKDLFREWETEISGMSDSRLKTASRQMLRETQQGSREVIKRMRTVEDKMHPVLQKFRDKVLFLKHNLNARAIKSLKGTTVAINNDVDLLVQDIDRSIAEADQFINSMKSEPTN